MQLLGYPNSQEHIFRGKQVMYAKRGDHEEGTHPHVVNMQEKTVKGELIMAEVANMSLGWINNYF